MKKQIAIILCASLLLNMLSGCGGEYTGVSGRDGSVSGGAVSGGAVSGGAVSPQAVSGGAITEKKLTSLSGQKDRTNWFCSDTNFYYMTSYGEDGFVEHNLVDGTERKIHRKNLWQLCYVDNDWVYYVVQAGREKDKLYRAPIKDNRVNIKKEECLFKEKNEIFTDIYCDGRYLLYITGDGMYRKYDLKENRDIGSLYKDEKYGDCNVLAVVDGYVYLRFAEKGLYRQKLDSEDLIRITKETVWGTAIAVMGEDVYYSEQYAMPFGIMKYHSENGRKEEVVSKAQIQALLRENQLLDKEAYANITEYDPAGMFVCGERIYVQLKLTWEGAGSICCKNIVFYLEPNKDGELHYAKELTECLVDEKPMEEYGKTFYSRGRCVEITEETCYMEIYNPETDKNTLAGYDFSSGEFRYMTDKEMAWYLPYYVAPYQMMEKLFGDMPHYKERDWDYNDLY